MNQLLLLHNDNYKKQPLARIYNEIIILINKNQNLTVVSAEEIDLSKPKSLICRISELESDDSIVFETQDETEIDYFLNKRLYDGFIQEITLKANRFDESGIAKNTSDFESKTQFESALNSVKISLMDILLNPDLKIFTNSEQLSANNYVDPEINKLASFYALNIENSDSQVIDLLVTKQRFEEPKIEQEIKVESKKKKENTSTKLEEFLTISDVEIYQNKNGIVELQSEITVSLASDVIKTKLGDPRKFNLEQALKYYDTESEFIIPAMNQLLPTIYTLYKTSVRYDDKTESYITIDAEKKKLLDEIYLDNQIPTRTLIDYVNGLLIHDARSDKIKFENKTITVEDHNYTPIDLPSLEEFKKKLRSLERDSEFFNDSQYNSDVEYKLINQILEDYIDNSPFSTADLINITGLNDPINQLHNLNFYFKQLFKDLDLKGLNEQDDLKFHIPKCESLLDLVGCTFQTLGIPLINLSKSNSEYNQNRSSHKIRNFKILNEKIINEVVKTEVKEPGFLIEEGDFYTIADVQRYHMNSRLKIEKLDCKTFSIGKNNLSHDEKGHGDLSLERALAYFDYDEELTLPALNEILPIMYTLFTKSVVVESSGLNNNCYKIIDEEAEQLFIELINSNFLTRTIIDYDKAVSYNLSVSQSQYQGLSHTNTTLGEEEFMIDNNTKADLIAVRELKHEYNLLLHEFLESDSEIPKFGNHRIITDEAKRESYEMWERILRQKWNFIKMKKSLKSLANHVLEESEDEYEEEYDSELLEKIFEFESDLKTDFYISEMDAVNLTGLENPYEMVRIMCSYSLKRVELINDGCKTLKEKNRALRKYNVHPESHPKYLKPFKQTLKTTNNLIIDICRNQSEYRQVSCSLLNNSLLEIEPNNFDEGFITIPLNYLRPFKIK